MELTWLLLIISFGLFFTKAGYLGTPYRLACISYLLMQGRFADDQWMYFVATFCTIDYLCARFFMARTDANSVLLKRLLLTGVAVNFFLGVDLAFNTNFVYDNWERIVQGLNILQIITLISGGYSAGLVDRDWFMDKYGSFNHRAERMVASLLHSCRGLLAKRKRKEI